MALICFKIVCSSLWIGVKHVTASAYHPQATGHIERFKKQYLLDSVTLRFKIRLIGTNFFYRSHIPTMPRRITRRERQNLGLSSFIFHPPDTLEQYSLILTDISTLRSPWSFWDFSLREPPTLKTRTDQRWQNPQVLYKYYFNKLVRVTPTFQQDKLLFLHHPAEQSTQQ